jgi:hypothetical protein
MKKRIWINVEGIKLGPFQLVLPNNLDKEKHIWVSAKIGNAFNINGIRIGNGMKPDSFVQNWSGCDARLLDVPGWHHGKYKKNPLLHDILTKEVYLFFNGPGSKDLRELMESGKPMPETSLLWEVCQKDDGKSLRIPIEFVRLRHIRFVGQDCVTTDIQIGSHLIFWSVEIFDGKVFGITNDRIINPELNEIINKMLEREDVQKTVHYVIERKFDDISAEFIDAIPDINIDKNPPPIRFY